MRRLTENANRGIKDANQIPETSQPPIRYFDSVNNYSNNIFDIKLIF